MASWFYLTLWRGNPPEMTEYLEATINTTDANGIKIIQSNSHSAAVTSTDGAIAMITRVGQASVTVEERNEVIWIVGEKH